MRLHELLEKIDETTNIKITHDKMGTAWGCAETLLLILRADVLNAGVSRITHEAEDVWIETEETKTIPARITRKFDFDGGDPT